MGSNETPVRDQRGNAHACKAHCVSVSSVVDPSLFKDGDPDHLGHNQPADNPKHFCQCQFDRCESCVHVHSSLKSAILSALFSSVPWLLLGLFAGVASSAWVVGDVLTRVGNLPVVCQ